MANGILDQGTPIGTTTTVSGRAVLILGGTFGGATIELQVQGADNNWYPSNRQYTQGDVDNINIFKSSEVRINAISGVTAETSIYWEIKT